MPVYNLGHTAWASGPYGKADAMQTAQSERWVAVYKLNDVVYKVYGTKQQVVNWMDHVVQTGNPANEKLKVEIV